MTIEERAARAAALANKPTRAERLAAVLGKINPGAAQPDGGWRVPAPPPWADPNEPGAPYLIRELDDGRFQLQVLGADGDVVGGVGETVEDALARVEEKIR